MSGDTTHALALVLQRLALIIILAFAFRSLILNIFIRQKPIRAIPQLLGVAFIFWGYFLYAPVVNPSWFPGLSLMVFGIALHNLPDLIRDTVEPVEN